MQSIIGMNKKEVEISICGAPEVVEKGSEVNLAVMTAARVMW